jgi:hypothetical protein
MSISKVTYTDLTDFVKQISRYEDILAEWKERHPTYDAKVTTYIGAKDYTIEVITCKRKLKE